MEVPAGNEVKRRRTGAEVEYGCLGHLIARHFLHGIWIGGELGCVLDAGAAEFDPEATELSISQLCTIDFSYERGIVDAAPVPIAGTPHLALLRADVMEDRLRAVQGKHPYFRVPRHPQQSLLHSSRTGKDARAHHFICPACEYPLVSLELDEYVSLLNMNSQEAIDRYLPQALLL